MKNNYYPDATQGIFFLVALTLILSCSPEMAAQKNQLSKTKENQMIVADTTEIEPIPSIDAAAPPTFETASFGLG